MAKPSRRQGAKERQEPTAGRPSKPPIDPETAAPREQKVLPVIAALSDPDVKQRSEAATAIADLVEDPRCRKLLRQERLVYVIMQQTVTESNFEVAAAGWAVLRNLVSEEDDGFLLHLYRQDILTPLLSAIRNVVHISDSNQPLSKLPRAQGEMVWNMAESLVTIVASLAWLDLQVFEACSDKALIVTFISGLLRLLEVPASLGSYVLLCLYSVVSRDSSIAKLVDHCPQLMKCLTDGCNKPGLNGAVACGVLYEVSMAVQGTREIRQMNQRAAEQVISPLLDAHLSEQRCRTYFPSDPGQKQVYRDPSDDENIDNKELIVTLELLATIAADHLSNAKGGRAMKSDDLNESGDEDMEDEGPEDDNGEDNDPIQTDSENGSVVGTADALEHRNVECKPLHVPFRFEGDLAAIFVKHIVPRMLKLRGALRNTSCSDSRDSCSKSIIKTPRLLQSKAASEPSATTCEATLRALEHIARALSIDALPPELSHRWRGQAQEIWTNVVQPVLESNTADIHLASKITGLAVAVAQSVRGYLNISSDVHKRIMALYQAWTSLDGHPARRSKAKKVISQAYKDHGPTLGVNCIAVLGSLALSCSDQPAQLSRNKDIGAFLIAILGDLPNGKTPPEDVIEVLNQIYDIYADKAFAYDEPVFVRGEFLAHLQAALPSVRKTAKSIDKRKRPRLREAADEALLNLQRFIEYKKNERQT